MSTPEQIAAAFMAHFVDAPVDEIEELEITRALGLLIRQVAIETVDILEDDHRVLH